MKLRELFENVYEEQEGEFDGALKTIGICYGRWNPPHKGHKEVWKQASTNPIWYVGTNQNTEGPKDPLPYEVKLQLMAAVWPGVAQHVIPEQDLFVMASHIYEKYGSNVHLKVYTDEEWLYNGLAKYNGMQDQKHGHYKFHQIDWVATKRLARATDLRAAVRNGDRRAFYKDAGIKPDTILDINGQQLTAFDVVAHYLNKYPEKVKKVAATEGIVNVPELSQRIKTMRTQGLQDSQIRQQLLKDNVPPRYIDQAFAGAEIGEGATQPTSEGAMSDVHLEISSHLDRPIRAYKAGRMDADHLGDYCVRFAHLLAKKLDVDYNGIQHLVNQYVEGELDSDMLSEGGMKKIDNTQKAAMKNATTFPGLNMNLGNGYTGYRFGLALAGAPDFPTKADNWIAGDPLLSPYTDEEAEMINYAAKQVGGGKGQKWSNKRSQEIDGVNTTSTTAKPKKNQYGV